MDFMNISVLSALKNKMNWHQTRQNVLAQNVANAETPGFMARELKAPSKSELQGFSSTLAMQAAERTNPKHIEISSRMSSGFREGKGQVFEVTPDGNGVVLEEQMMKVTQNQMDFQAASLIYSKSLGLLKTATRRSA